LRDYENSEPEEKMRKAIVFLLALCIVCVNALADEEAISISGKRVLLRDNGTWSVSSINNKGAKDFRNCRWGMSRKDVFKAEHITEKDLVYNEKRAIAINSSISGLSCNVIYIFAYDKLVRAKYYITESHTNNNIFIERDYPELTKQLATKYGEVTNERTVWSNDLYKDDPKDWGTALGFGHVSFGREWGTDTTSIYLFLFGDNFKVSFGIEYQSKELIELEEKQQDEDSSSQL
jgi:hypothetical protein